MINIKQNQSAKRQRKAASSDDEDTNEYEECPLSIARVTRTAQHTVKLNSAGETKAKHVSGNQSDTEENADYSQNGASERNSQEDSQTSSLWAKRSKLPNAKGLPASDYVMEEQFDYFPAHSKQASFKAKYRHGIGKGDGNGMHEAMATVKAQLR
jgi:hypothetical protein